MGNRGVAEIGDGEWLNISGLVNAVKGVRIPELRV